MNATWTLGLPLGSLLALGCSTERVVEEDTNAPTATVASAFTTADIDVLMVPRSVTATVYARGAAQFSRSSIAGAPDPTAIVDLPCDVSAVEVSTTVSYKSAAAAPVPLYALFRTSVREAGYTGFVSQLRDVTPALAPNTLTGISLATAPIGPNGVQPASLLPNRQYRVEMLMAGLSACPDRFDSACGYGQLGQAALANDIVAFQVRRVCP